jgi:hypothetical protein
MSQSFAAALADAVEDSAPRLPDATRSSPAATAAWHLIRRLRKRQADGDLVVRPEKLDGEPGWRIQVSLREALAALPGDERDGASEQGIRRYLAGTRNLVPLTRGARPAWWLPDLAGGWRDVSPAAIAQRQRALTVVQNAPPAGQDVLEEDPDEDDWGAVSKAAMVHACSYCPTARYRTDQERRKHERDDHPGSYWSNTALICVRVDCEYPARSEAAYRNHLSVVHRCSERAEQAALVRQAINRHDPLLAAADAAALPAPRPARPHLRSAAEAGATVLEQARAFTATEPEGEGWVSDELALAAAQLAAEATEILTRYHAQRLLQPA